MPRLQTEYDQRRKLSPNGANMEDQEEQIDDPNVGGSDPQGNAPSNDPGNVNQEAATATDLEINGVKLSLDALKGHEKLKDVFDAYENRQKWQAKLTQESQKVKQLQRDALEFQRLKSDPRFAQFMQGGQPQNRIDQIRQQFIQKATSQWGNNVDPNFINFMGDYIAEISGHRAKEAIEPFQNQYFSEWESNFLNSHPLIQPGTEKFEELKNYLASGVNPEKAYKAVYQEEIMQKEIEDRIKKRDDENRKKLNNSRRVNGTVQQTMKPKSFGESFDRAWANHGGD